MAVTEPAAVELLDSVSRLVRTARTYAHLRNQQLGRTGLPLGILARLAGATMRPGDLASQLGVSPSAVSRAVAGLIEAGFVERTTDPSDARACSLALTVAGSTELEHLHHEQARMVGAVLDGWDDAKAGTLTDLLDEFGSALSGSVLDTRHPPYAASSPTAPTVAPAPAQHTTEKAFA